ncbi:coA binding domain protein, partial [Vibrio parahaemolyticus EKP-028]
NPRFKLH